MMEQLEILLKILPAVLVSAAATFLMRSLPFLIFRGDRKMPQWMERLGEVLPSAIMAVLVVYCLKDVTTSPIGIGIPSLVGVAITAATYKWKKSTFLSIAAGTMGYMVVLRMF